MMSAMEKRLSAQPSGFKNLFETNIYTRHFPVDPAQFKGPFERSRQR